MKNYLILAIVLMTGLSAYPQATRTARESKNEKGTERKESVQRSSNRTDRNQAAERKVSSGSRDTQRAATRSSGNQRSGTSAEPARTRVNTGQRDAVRPQPEIRKRVQTGERVAEPAGRPTGSTRSAANRTVRDTEDSRDRSVRVNTSSANRIYREGNGTLTRDDGKVIRHQNDEVFVNRKYKLDFDNYENLRRSDEFRRGYREYDHWYNNRHRRIVIHHHTYVPVPWDLHRARYYYRMPRHYDLIWTPLLFHRFMYYYPLQLTWNMEFGSQIETISAYEAKEYAGTVRQVYGKVQEVYYSPEDENYILYVGGPFPYHDLSIVIPRHVAKNISMSPKWYFEDEFIWVVGLINIWEGQPEIIIRDEEQIRRY